MKYFLILFMCLTACGSEPMSLLPPEALPEPVPVVIAPVPKPKPKPKVQKFVGSWQHRILLLKTKTGLSSGFAIDKDKIITAAHFCSDMDQKTKIQVYYMDRNNKIKFFRNARIDKISEKVDVCVLKKKDHGLVISPLAKYRNVKVFDPVMIGGAPLGFFPYLDKGYVMQTRNRDRSNHGRFDKALMIKGLGTYGLSGGPVMNQRGEIIGMINGKHKLFDGVLFAVRSSAIKRFLVKSYGK